MKPPWTEIALHPDYVSFVAAVFSRSRLLLIA